MNGFALILSDGLILGTALWGQFWRMSAIRSREVIEFMVAEEVLAQEETPDE